MPVTTDKTARRYEGYRILRGLKAQAFSGGLGEH
jgi:hypothetical protein